MYEMVSVKRWELVEQLRREGPMTIYALARRLDRDYKNVHTDVKALETVGIVHRDTERKVLVPWDEIDLKVPLAA